MRYLSYYHTDKVSLPLTTERDSKRADLILAKQAYSARWNGTWSITNGRGPTWRCTRTHRFREPSHRLRLAPSSPFRRSAVFITATHASPR